MIKIILVICILILNNYVIAQQIHKSAKYGYTIELPKGFSERIAKGKNVDLKLVNNVGNSIVIVVKMMPPEQQNYDVYDMANISSKDWEIGLSEGLPNPKFIKSGKSYLDGKKTYWYHYTSKDETEPYTIIS